MSRPRAYFFGLAVVAAVAYPVAFPPGYDSYPLSSYPMFSYRRDRPTVYFARTIGADGEARRVPPELVGSGEVMQAAVTVRRAVQGGKKRMRALCRSIARRVAASRPDDRRPDERRPDDRRPDDRRPDEPRRVELVSAEFEPVAYFVDGPEPMNLRRHHRCSIRRSRR